MKKDKAPVSQEEVEGQKEQLKPADQIAEQEKTPEQIMEEAVNEGVDEALLAIKEAFEENSDERERMAFHNVEHTKGVMSRAAAVLSKIESAAPELVTERKKQLVRLAAAYHDLVQKWDADEIEEDAGTKVMRKRRIGDNERASANKAVEFMGQHEGAFTKEEQEEVRQALAATEPTWDGDNNTVVQAELTPDSSIVARALALADIGEAGTDPEAFLAGGDALFREENFDILEAAKNPDALTEAQKDYYRGRMQGWSESQTRFAAGRKALLDKELEGLPDAAREAVKGLFASFDISINQAEKRAKSRANMSFEELLDDMGY